MGYVSLPGVFPTLIDGNLTIAAPETAPRVLILGTASSGLSEVLFKVGRPQDARTEFGLDGSLIRGMYEAQLQGATNVFLMRIGGTSCSLTGIGCTAGPGTGGYSVTPLLRDDEAGARYAVSFDPFADILMVFDLVSEIIVFSNDPAAPVDLGVVVVRGAMCIGGGGPIGTVSAPVALEDVATPGTVYTAGTDGLNPSFMELWEALYNAYGLLDFQRFDIVTPMDTYLDVESVVDATIPVGTWTAMGLDDSYPPVTGTLSTFSNVLGRVFVQKFEGENLFWWDIENNGVANIWPAAGASTNSTDANGNSLTTDDFKEVNFAYQLANFCYNATENYQACIGVIGVLPPGGLLAAGFGAREMAAWIGELPEFSIDPITGVGTVVGPGNNGSGLLGNKFMAGQAGFRAGEQYGGFIATSTGYVGDDELVDENDALVDIGKYLSIVAHWGSLRNGSSRLRYVGNFAASYAGFISKLGSASAPTNKAVKGATVLARVPAATLDDLATYRYISLVQKAKGIVITDAPTAARPQSDYARLTTVRIVAEAVQRIRNVADVFIGEPMSTPQIAALDTAIDGVLNILKSEGKLNNFKKVLRISPQDAVLGTARLDLILVPAFELRRILLTVSLAAEIA
tara:strand:- start:17948 stop:19831 length:1884 start_codon:yes stop_codon:yes gene_type:complete